MDEDIYLPLDEEWTLLIQEALQIGVTPYEIRKFLNLNKQK
ncbi:anti-repressor SinI family protein [Evansella sp. AB-P1]|nr:anti-repressor SinI family protein [Evansella sp. AB-P1]MDG5788763.1 anti-repressor SinI family protein [Evansella sp. AB-P1]